MMVVGTAYNRAYLASVLCTSAQIQQSLTSDTLGTLCVIMEEERLIAKRKAISFQKKGCAWYIKVKYKE
ncbi:MAG: hypothetical protein AMJ90_09905 [candidate division Zixibacteria bacterium SM23_73_2]|nr:MAG: hypothetical protein AMJ90_09905 [candidate division Zixibacteria bacterium SM23_73_2]